MIKLTKTQLAVGGAIIFIILVILFTKGPAPQTPPSTTTPTPSEPQATDSKTTPSKTTPSQTTPSSKTTPTKTAGLPPLPAFPTAKHSVFYRTGSFSPATLTVKPGDIVEFFNGSSEDMWVASAIHPTHRVYPVSGGCIGSTFDACRGVKPGGSWTFKFDVKGNWGYHNHLSPSARGTITVASIDPMLHIIHQGGKCPYLTVCSDELVIYKNNTYRYIINQIEQGAGELGEAALSELSSLTENTNFNTLRANQFTGTCPSTSGGKENTYVFYTSRGGQKLSDCENVIDYTSPLFKKINEITRSVFNYRYEF